MKETTKVVMVNTDWAASRRKVSRMAKAWVNLLCEGVLSPLRPSAPRLRRALIAGEMLRSRLPLVRLETLVQNCLEDTDPLALKALPVHDHNCTLFELMVLGVVTKAVRARAVLEIGTYDGRSALAMASNVVAGGKVYTLNLPPNYAECQGTRPLNYDEKLGQKVTSGYRWRGHFESGVIQQLFGNSIDFDFLPFAPFQIIFIDGDHSREIVRTDSEKCLKVLDKKNGMILWHDSTRYGVKPVLESMASRGRKIHLIEGTTIAFLWFVDGVEVGLYY